MNGCAADQQGGRSDGAFQGDGEPGTVNGGGGAGPTTGMAGQTYSAAAGAVQRLGLASRLQQGTVLQDTLKQIKKNILLMMKRTHIKINSPAMQFLKTMMEMKRNRTAKEVE